MSNSNIKYLDTEGLRSVWSKIKGLISNKADLNSVYTKTEIDNLLNTAFRVEIVESLPTTDIKTDVIYLVPRENSETNNVYNEYLYISNSWELIGDTSIDVSGKQDKLEFDGTYNAETNKAATVDTVKNYPSGKYVTCATARNVTAKVVNLEGFELKAGARITVKFTNAGSSKPSSGNITLNVNNTGAKTVYSGRMGAASTAINYSNDWFYSNRIHDFIYDGTYWITLGGYDSNTTYTFDGTYNSSTNKAATVSTVTNAIGALDVTTITGTTLQTITSISETDGKISATYSDIATMGAATSSAAGTKGLVPAPGVGKQDAFLRGDGKWEVPTDTTYEIATSSTAGLVKSSTTGTTPGKDYLVEVNSDGTMKVNVPWTDSDSTDTKVTQTNTATTDTNTYPILFTSVADKTDSDESTARYSAAIKASPDGTVTATKFVGALDGSVAWDNISGKPTVLTNNNFKNYTREGSIITCGNVGSSNAFWAKLAEGNCGTTATEDYHLHFLISDTYSHPEVFAEYRLRFRTEGTIGVAATAGLLGRDGVFNDTFFKKDFIKVFYTNTSGTKIHFEIWFRYTYAWQGARFKIIDEFNRNNTTSICTSTSRYVATTETLPTVSTNTKEITQNWSSKHAIDISGTATKASADGDGNNIVDTYLPKSNGTAKNLSIENSAADTFPTVSFSKDNTKYGSIGMKDEQKAYIWSSSGNNEKQIAIIDDLSDYLPLSGGTMTGNITFENVSNVGDTSNGITFGGGNDRATINYTVKESDLGVLNLNMVDDANPLISLNWPNSGKTVTSYTFNSDGLYSGTSERAKYLSGRGYAYQGSVAPFSYPTGLTYHSVSAGNTATNTGWPSNYGEVLTLRQFGGLQIFGEWSGAQSDTASAVTSLKYRSQRDVVNKWTDWNTVLTDKNYTSYLDSAYTKKVEFKAVDISGLTTTILAQVKAQKGTSLETAQKEIILYCKNNGASAGISDKPTTSNTSFVVSAKLARWDTVTDYTYFLTCYMSGTARPYTALASYNTASLSWSAGSVLSDLSSYLPLSGGTLTGNLTSPAVLKSDTLKTTLSSKTGTELVSEGEVVKYLESRSKLNNYSRIKQNAYQSGYDFMLLADAEINYGWTCRESTAFLFTAATGAATLKIRFRVTGKWANSMEYTDQTADAPKITIDWTQGLTPEQAATILKIRFSKSEGYGMHLWLYAYCGVMGLNAAWLSYHLYPEDSTTGDYGYVHSNSADHWTYRIADGDRNVVGTRTSDIAGTYYGQVVISTSNYLAGQISTAATATKVGSTTVGSATQGIYLNNGTPTACTYTLEKSVPSTAIFSNMTGSTTSAAGSAGYVPQPDAGTNDRFLRCDGTWAIPSGTGSGESVGSGKVIQSITATDQWRPLILGFQSDSANTAAVTSNTEQVYGATLLKARPSTGTVYLTNIHSPLNTSTYLRGNQGWAMLASTNTPGTYTTVHRTVSTNGYFTQSTYQGSHILGYTAKSTVDAGTNSLTKQAVLLDENGNASWPGSVTATEGFIGNATSATRLVPIDTFSSGAVTDSNKGWWFLGNITFKDAVGVNSDKNKKLIVDSWVLNQTGSANRSFVNVQVRQTSATAYSLISTKVNYESVSQIYPRFGYAWNASGILGLYVYVDKAYSLYKVFDDDDSSITFARGTFQKSTATVTEINSSINDSIRHISQDGTIALGGYWARMATNSNTGLGYSSTWGHVISMDWTGDGKWASQLALPSGDATAADGMKYRVSSSSGVWGSWITSLDSLNYTNYTVGKDGTGATGTWGISISGNAATSTKATSLVDYSSTANNVYVGWAGNTISSVGQTNSPTSFLACYVNEAGTSSGNCIKDVAASNVKVGYASTADTATTATTATKATQDGSGNNIASTYLPKSGGTMTGALTVITGADKGNIVTSPNYSASAGSNLVNASKARGSEVGSVMIGTTWYDWINLRHRNGSGDGTNYGMYLYSTMTSDGSLLYNKQTGASTWTGERTLLDSNNYTSYTVKKDGTGATGTWGINVTGNAATATSATSATKATQDGSGNVITSTYQPLLNKVNSIELGSSRTEAGSCYIDLHSNTSGDYDGRIIVDSSKNMTLQSGGALRTTNPGTITSNSTDIVQGKTIYNYVESKLAAVITITI